MSIEKLRTSIFLKRTISIILGIFVIYFTVKVVDNIYGLITISKFKKTYIDYTEKSQETTDYQNQLQIFYQEIDTLLNLEKYDEAIEKMQNRLIQFPCEESFLLHDIGIVHYYKEDIDSAIIYYSMAISSDSSFTIAYVNRAYCFQELNNLDLAIADFKTAAKIDKYYYYSLGLAQEKNGQEKEALESYYQYYNYDPYDKECLEKIIYLKDQ